MEPSNEYKNNPTKQKTQEGVKKNVERIVLGVIRLCGGGSAPLTLCILLIASVQRSTAGQQEKTSSHQPQYMAFLSGFFT